jgi:ankyrin repeat protein
MAEEMTLAGAVQQLCGDAVDAALLEQVGAGSIQLPWLAAIAGEAAQLRSQLEADPEALERTDGPRQWPPLLYVSYSPLNKLEARQADFAECAQLLLAQGADADTHYTEPSYPDSPLSALYGAVGMYGNALLADVLLRHGANTQDGESIYHAAQLGHLECLEVLKKHGADFSAVQQPWGNTPLYFLLGHRPTDEQWPSALTGVRWLLEEGGADPNVASGDYEEMPLHLVARRHGAEQVEQLLEHEAHADAPTRDGLTPYAVAARFSNLEALDVLRKHGAEMPLTATDNLLAAISCGDEVHAKALLRAEPGLAAKLGGRDYAVLVEAAGQGKLKAVDAWCALGLPLDSQADCQSTALHQACWYAHQNVARALIEHRAPLDIKDEMYQGTPLDWVCHGSLFCRAQPGSAYAQLGQLLIDAGSPLPANDWGSEEVQAVLKQARG